MKRYLNIISCAGILALTLISSGCNKVLEEHPQSQIVPAFFNTPAGVLGGIAGVYNEIRNLWGTEGWSMQLTAGTDEVLEGASATSTDFFTYNPLSSNDESGGIWTTAYTDINTLNGVLQFGAALTGLDAATKAQYLAQAKFLRAFYYFYLVQNWGDVPLHLTYITAPSTADSRQPMADVYTQIIKDLTDASTQLPAISPVIATAANPFGGKAAAQGAALYLLGKVYLTRGYTAAGSAADFTQAATILSNLITNKATYGFNLYPDFAQAFWKANDYGTEVIFNSDHSSDTKYGEYIAGSSGNNGNNLLPWFNRPNYPTFAINASINGSGALALSGSTMMTRDVNNGRPYIRMRPNNALLSNPTLSSVTGYVVGQAFADIVNDSRYDKTFQTVWIANTANVTGTRGTLTVGVDTAIWIPPYEVAGAPTARNGAPFKGIIIPPSLQSNSFFPAVRKFDDSTRTGVNDPSTRTVQIFRFSDAYLLCAEAYFKAGDNVNAAKYLNVVRERAAFRTTNTAAQNAAAALAMDILPSQVTIDFILDERTRELYGEGSRWWDLQRTGQLVARVKKWNPVEAGGHIQSFHALRPIPQNEIDLVTSGPKFPQNPGY